jgi:hypothetical protein
MKIKNKDSRELAKELAQKYNLRKADYYDLVEREYDKLLELIAKIPDPNYSMEDFVGREMCFPFRWITLAVVDAKTLKMV